MTERPTYGFKPVAVEPCYKGYGLHVVYRFDNGYGASIMPDSSYRDDEKELAVVKWYGRNVGDYEVITKTPVTFDVLRLYANEIEDVLRKISLLTDEQVEAYQKRLIEEDRDS